MEKRFWEAIHAHNFALPPEPSLAELTAELLGYLGALDPFLRDEIGYYVLAHWIDRGHYTPAEMVALADQMVTNLKTGLGEPASETAFAWAAAEVDLRGYDLQHGWIHTGAHGGDLLRVIGKHPRVTELDGVLDAIASLPTRHHGHPFHFDEDERPAGAQR